MIVENPQGLERSLNAIQRDIENSEFEQALSRLESIENGLLRSSLRERIEHCVAIAQALDKVSLLVGKEKLAEARALLQATTIPAELDFLQNRAAHLGKLIDACHGGAAVERERAVAAEPVAEQEAPAAAKRPVVGLQPAERGRPAVYASPVPARPVVTGKAPVDYGSLMGTGTSVITGEAVAPAKAKVAEEGVRCPVCHKAIQAIEVEDEAQSLRCPMCGYTSKREFFFGPTPEPVARQAKGKPAAKGGEVAAMPGPRKLECREGVVSFVLENEKPVRIEYDLARGAEVYLAGEKVRAFTGDELKQWQELVIGGQELALRCIRRPWPSALLLRENGLRARLDGVRIGGIYGDFRERIKYAPICFPLYLIATALAYFTTQDDLEKMYSAILSGAIMGLYLVFLRYKLLAASITLALMMFDAVVFAQNAIQTETYITAPLPVLGCLLMRAGALLLLIKLLGALLELGRARKVQAVTA